MVEFPLAFSLQLINSVWFHFQLIIAIPILVLRRLSPTALKKVLLEHLQEISQKD